MSELDMNWELLANKDYAFLTESPLLGNNILLLTLGGSHAYGTNVETSDIDVRGITYNPVDSLLGNRVFEQYEDEATDTVVYGLNKMFKLLLECNPNTIEQLGSKPEHYIILNDDGKKLIENRKSFFLKERFILSVVTQIHSYAGCKMHWQETVIHRQRKKNIFLDQSEVQ